MQFFNMMIRWVEPSDFRPKSDDLGHRIIKSDFIPSDFAKSDCIKQAHPFWRLKNKSQQLGIGSHNNQPMRKALQIFFLLSPLSINNIITNSVLFDASGDFFFFFSFFRHVSSCCSTTSRREQTWPGIMCPHWKNFAIVVSMSDGWLRAGSINRTHKFPRLDVLCRQRTEPYPG